ncbi:MAG: peptidoglycan bridge formation glycyltransferase FemA/FemB family protein [Candidatus Thorarchaeota archaeon]|nr:peptidoglycan bridge formation glycyltransferase FemA/FemB family protein [Candidatus Thorarchaeota archaeon]
MLARMGRQGEIASNYDWIQSRAQVSNSCPLRLIVEHEGRTAALVFGRLIWAGHTPLWCRRVFVLGGLEGSPLIVPKSQQDTKRSADILAAAVTRIPGMCPESKSMVQIDGWAVHIHSADKHLTETLLKLGFVPKARVTPVLALNRTKEELWAGLDKKTRNAVRQAEKRGVEVHHSQSAESFEQYLSLKGRYYGELRERDVQSYRLALRAGLLHIVTARADGRLLGAAAFIITDAEVGYLGSAMDRSSQWYRPMDAIMWAAIMYGHENGQLRLNMFGADFQEPRLRRITQFKMGFGCRLQPFTTFIGLSTRVMGRSVLPQRAGSASIRIIERSPLVKRLSPI